VRADVAYIILGVVVSAGCGADRRPAPEEERSPAAQVPASAAAGMSAKTSGDELRALFEPFAIAEMQGHLQGTWVFAGGIHNVATAWHVEGPSFTYIDDEGGATPGTLEVRAPCEIAHVDTSRAPSTVTNDHTVLASADGVLRGGSSIGRIRGDTFVVCTSGGIVLGDSEQCGLWREVGGVETQWRRSEATCGFTGESGSKEHFWAKAEGVEELRLDVHGELLLSWSPEDMRARRVTSLDAAIAAVRTANAVTDPPE